ncbi:hypothetical protein KUTeg_017889 [Tegillarca granosa]|uniref:Uncharacterized protein n=1 Tax=Tegillarca granosa TaxID=220873 RepID=A0ABQ9EIQ6_TEGGR|nr:hypothetical protein KUTeg_017889 [Tegillarca granosa]
MADLLGNPQVVNGLRWVFDKCDFGCKQIGLSCNAYRPRIFTKAECDSRPILCGRGNGGVSIDFVNLFETGFRIISQLKLVLLKQVTFMSSLSDVLASVFTQYWTMFCNALH